IVPAPRETMAQGWMVTVAGPLIEMLFGTEWVVPPPAQCARAAMFPACVTTVPLAGPQLAVPVTLRVAVPARVGSARLVALTVYVPGAEATDVALVPSGVHGAPG